MPVDTTLKPCPFCGGVASSYWHVTHQVVACETCTAGVTDAAPVKAIAAWNRRAAPAADDLRAENERLRTDCASLLAQIDALQVNTGEDLEAEDRAIVDQIRADLRDTQEASHVR